MQWRTLKIYVAGLRYYYQEQLLDSALASQIPYPKEKPSLPKVVSRSELQQVFDSCLNLKHKVMFRLLYSAGLRRTELVNLRLDFIVRFLQHVLPKRFTKIRHYGFLSTRSKKVDLPRIRALLGAATPEKAPQLTARAVLLKTTGVDP